MLLSGTVYGLSCLDGPILYVGCTYKPLDHRISVHWASRGTSPSAVHAWMRRIESKDHLTVTVFETVTDDSNTAFDDRILWKRETFHIKEQAVSIFNSLGLLTLNVHCSPYRHAIYGIRQPFRDNNKYELAECVSPYKFASIEHLQPTGGAK